MQTEQLPEKNWKAHGKKEEGTPYIDVTLGENTYTGVVLEMTDEAGNDTCASALRVTIMKPYGA